MAKPDEFFRKVPTQSRSRSVVGAILAATDQLLSSSGDPSRLTLEGVAKRAGVGIGSLYDYFANREGLLGALVARITEANFAILEREVAATQAMPMTEAISLILERALDTYLQSPTRTRGIVSAIFRLDWIKPVVRERDRFADLLTRRLLIENPRLDPVKLRLTGEVMCDCVMGVAVTELWRDRSPAELANVRAELRRLVEQQLAGLLVAER